MPVYVTNVRRHLRTLPKSYSSMKVKKTNVRKHERNLNPQLSTTLQENKNIEIESQEHINLQRGLITDIAKKAYLGFKHALEWERKHLPNQIDWIKQEYAKAKETFSKAYESAPDKLAHLRSTVRDFAEDLHSRNEIDRAEVASERDLDENGTPEVPAEAFDSRNLAIRQQINTIDSDKNSIPDNLELARQLFGTRGDKSFIGEQIKPLVKSGSPLDKLISLKKREISFRTELTELETTAPVSFLMRELRKNPDLIYDLPDEKLKQLAIRLPKKATSIFGGVPSPNKELFKRRYRTNELVREGLN